MIIEAQPIRTHAEQLLHRNKDDGGTWTINSNEVWFPSKVIPD